MWQPLVEDLIPEPDTTQKQNTVTDSSKPSSNLSEQHSDSQNPKVHIMDRTHIRCDKRGRCVCVCLALGSVRQSCYLSGFKKVGVYCSPLVACMSAVLLLSRSSSFSLTRAVWYGVYRSEHAWISSATLRQNPQYHLSYTFTHTNIYTHKPIPASPFFLSNT